MAKKVKALQRIYYGGREYNPGDKFDTYADTEAEAMVLVGTAEYVTESKPEPAPKRATRAKVEEAAAEPNLLEEPRRYNRRDMRAEDN